MLPQPCQISVHFGSDFDYSGKNLKHTPFDIWQFVLVVRCPLDFPPIFKVSVLFINALT